MKLHLPKVLFVAVMALSASALAAEYTITGNNDGKIHSATAEDTITFNKTNGHLTSGGGNINAAVVIDNLQLTDGYSDKTYTFNNTVSGTGDFSFGGSTGANRQTYVFNGSMDDYSGNMTIAADKTATLTFNNSTGTGTITATNAASKVNIDSATINASAINTVTINVTGGESIVAANSAMTFTNMNLANGSTLSVEEGKTLTLTGTVNVTTTGGVTTNPEEGKNGIASSTFTDVAIFTGNGTTDWSNATVKINGVDVTLTSGTFSGTIANYIVNEESATLTASMLAMAPVVVMNASSALTVTEGATLTFEAIQKNNGAAVTGLTVSNGGTLITEGDNNAGGFTTAPISIEAGGTLLLKGHDALGYNNGEGKGSATPLIEMQGEAGNKAVLESQDTSNGNPANLTFTTDLHLKGHTEVKGNALKVFGMELTATGTDNTVSSNLILDKAMTVNVTDAADTLTISGNISGTNAMTKTGDGTLTISGSTIGNNVTLNNTGSGAMVLDTVALGGRLNIYNSTGTKLTGGATTTVENNHALVVSNGNNDVSVTLENGTYDLGTAHTGVGARGTLTVAKDATLSTNMLQNSGTLTNNGTLTIEGDSTSKGSVTANGSAKVVTLNNAGDATFNAAFEASTVNLTGDSTTTFNGATTIGTMTIADTAVLAGTGAVTITTGITAVNPVDVTINDLTLNAGTTVELGANHTGQLTTSALTINSNANSELHINADLVIINGGTITFNGGVVTLGCSVDFGTGTTIALGTAYNADLEANGHVLLFQGVDEIIGELSSVAVTGAFSGGKLYAVQQADNSYNIYATPEPATATLSLLALAGLCARRKRH